MACTGTHVARVFPFGCLVIMLAISGCAATPPPRARSATALDAIESVAVERLRSLAAANKEQQPADIRVVETDEGDAMTALFGSAADPRQESERVIVLMATGNFVGEAAKVPSGAAYPTGDVLTMIFNRATEQITDWGISSTRPELSTLGAVIEVS